MKRVIIVRHAKSVPYGYDDDFNRDLKYPRGFSDAAKVSGEFRKQQVFPDLIISSPAKRALKTAGRSASNRRGETLRLERL